MKPSIAIFIFFLLVAVLASFWSFSPAFNGEFILDDQSSLHLNHSCKTLDLSTVLNPDRDSPLGGRPISNLSFALNFAISGYDGFSYRVVNWLLHLGGSAFLYLTLRAVISRDRKFDLKLEWLVLLLVSLWACHPLQTATVPYLAQRTEVLAGFFSLGSIYFAIVSFARSTRAYPWAIASFIFCILAVASKEVAAVVPIIIFLIDRAYFSESWKDPLVRRRFFYLGLVLAWALVVYLFLGTGARGVGHSGGVTTWKYLLTQSRVVLTYVSLVFFPYPLVFDRGISVYGATAADYKYFALLVALVSGALVGLVRNPKRWLCPVLFLVILAPSSSFIPIWRQPMAENRLYLASAALMIPVFMWFFDRAPRATIGLLVVFLFGASTYSHQRSQLMASAVALNRDIIMKVEENPFAWINYGKALMLSGDLDQATKAFEIAYKSKSAKAQAAGSLGMVAEVQGEYKKALEHYLEALKDRSLIVLYGIRLGTMYQRLGKLHEAQGIFDRLEQIAPNNGDLFLFGALVAIDSGDLDLALARIQRAQTLDPLSPSLAAVQMAVHYARGEMDRVADLAAKGNKEDPEDSRSLLYLALTSNDLQSREYKLALIAHGVVFRDSVLIRRSIISELTRRGLVQEARLANEKLNQDLAVLDQAQTPVELK
ncbi:MAG: tetratricopeptide repeat protein [Opitutaceae bacterium]|nr:tetratricopeptide repeat protein [Opitutaceae bacterium]